MGCGLETAIAVRTEMIEQGRLSRELWVVAPADSYGLTGAQRREDLCMMLGGLAQNWTRQELSTRSNVDKETTSRLKEMGARGNFYLYRAEIDYTPETSTRLARLKDLHWQCIFATYEKEKPIARVLIV